MAIMACKEQPQHEIYSPKVYDKFENFGGFPNFIFKQIRLGEPAKDILAQIVSQPGTIFYQDEYFHYQYAADSTEIIIPEQTNLTRFKLFLKGAIYLTNEADFIRLFEEKAYDFEENVDYKVYKFSNHSNPFVITYFRQTDYIRLTIQQTIHNN